MLRKSRRILWLLNHKTLMPYEVPLIMNLGFEVFVPKNVPKTNFRSAAVSFDYDKSLTIPKAVLNRLNKFDFYLSDWPPDIINLINRYFGTIFIIPYGRQVIEAVKHFDGEIVFRAFGLDNKRTYDGVLTDMYGRGFRYRLESVRDRFWFGEGYNHLHECETALFKERALFLPIGIPNSFFRNEGKWQGSLKKILFVAPNVVTDPYYGNVYQEFKKNFGDLPHVIVGQQDTTVDDPHMAGFVTDEELQNLYLDCAAFYYHSREPRHVHYSPVEAAINGMPIVYYEDSLLGRMCPNSVKGRVTSIGEAREVLQRILSGDTAFIAEIREDQRDVAYHFSDAYCRPVWKNNLEVSGLLAKLAKQSSIKTLSRELHRSAFRVIGRVLDNSEDERPLPNAATAKKVTGSSVADGISFNLTDLPACVTDIKGLSEAEPWGRWSDAERVVITLNHLLDKEFVLDVTAIGHDCNAGADIKVKIGSVSQIARFGADMDNAQTVSLSFRLRRPTNVIEFTVPHPTQPANDSRMIGLGLVRLKMRPLSEGSVALDESLHLSQEPAKVKTFIEAGIVAASVPEVGQTAQPPALQADRGTAAADIVAHEVNNVGAARLPAWRRAARAFIRRARPILLPFSHRFRGHVRTAIEETAILPQLSEVSSELVSLRNEIASLRGALDRHVRQQQIEAKAVRAAIGELSAVLSQALKQANGSEAAIAHRANAFEATPERRSVDGK